MLATACTSNPLGGSEYDSVRDRLSDGPTRLSVGATDSTGAISARRWTPSGWVEGTTNVTIADGELSAKVDGSGKLTVDAFEVGFASIAIPEEVFKKPATLENVRVTLTDPATAEAQWTSDDDATATLLVDLDFDWSIEINGGRTPLATQKLPPVAVDIALTGGGDHVDAALTLRATGELWNWAGLLEMTSLELSLNAATLD